MAKILWKVEEAISDSQNCIKRCSGTDWRGRRGRWCGAPESLWTYWRLDCFKGTTRHVSKSVQWNCERISNEPCLLPGCHDQPGQDIQDHSQSRWEFSFGWGWWEREAEFDQVVELHCRLQNIPSHAYEVNFMMIISSFVYIHDAQVSKE